MRKLKRLTPFDAALVACCGWDLAVVITMHPSPMTWLSLALCVFSFVGRRFQK